MALGRSHDLSAAMFSLETVFSIPLGVLEGDVYYEVTYRLSIIEITRVHVIFYISWTCWTPASFAVWSSGRVFIWGCCPTRV